MQWGQFPMTRRTLLLPLLLAALCILAGAFAARAQGGEHRAGLVIRYADGSVQTQCVSFSESSITGEDLLQRAGLAVTLNFNIGQGNMGSYNTGDMTGAAMKEYSAQLDAANAAKAGNAGLGGALGSIGGALLGKYLLPGIGGTLGSKIGGGLGGAIGGRV